MARLEMLIGHVGGFFAATMDHPQSLAAIARNTICGRAHVTRFPDTEFGACFARPHSL
jgi:hypothetical protein